MKLWRNRGSKDSIADEHLTDLVVNILNKKIRRSKTKADIDRAVNEGNKVLDSAAATKRAFKRGLTK